MKKLVDHKKNSNFSIYSEVLSCPSFPPVVSELPSSPACLSLSNGHFKCDVSSPPPAPPLLPLSSSSLQLNESISSLNTVDANQNASEANICIRTGEDLAVTDMDISDDDETLSVENSTVSCFINEKVNNHKS